MPYAAEGMQYIINAAESSWYISMSIISIISNEMMSLGRINEVLPRRQIMIIFLFNNATKVIIWRA